MDFLDIEYLKLGSPKQQSAYKELTVLGIFDKLSEFNPILTGTIPIEIDISSSDLDIVCQCDNHSLFQEITSHLYGNCRDFSMVNLSVGNKETSFASFKGRAFTIELFAQNIPSQEQNAYRHMLVEYKILKEQDASFRKEIIQLKQEGFSTEEAFAQKLGLKGNPYQALLSLGNT